MYWGLISQNVENAWQYSKVYQRHLIDNDFIGQHWVDWAKEGWNNKNAVRYPEGKGTIPQFTFWAGKRLSYIGARKHVYVPLYIRALKDYAWPSIEKLRDTIKYEDVYIWDFDWKTVQFVLLSM